MRGILTYSLQDMNHDDVVICDQGICDYDPRGTGDHATVNYTYTGFLETDAAPFTAAFYWFSAALSGRFYGGNLIVSISPVDFLADCARTYT